MKVTTSKSKNSESFYIAKSFINDKGVSTSVNIRKLGTLKELIKEHGPTRDDVMAWARAEAKLETMRYKAENEAKKVKKKSVKRGKEGARDISAKKVTAPSSDAANGMEK